LALDIRGEWRDALLRREDPASVSRAMAARLGDSEDPDDVTAWVALAAAQHETGYLQPDVRDRAHELIAAGSGLELWEESELLNARRAVLQRLADKLRGPQPKPKRLRGPRAIDPGVEVGDILRIYDERRSLAVLFAVIGISHAIPAQPHPLVLGLYADPHRRLDVDSLAQAPYLSDLDFTAFHGDDAPDHLGLAVPALQWIITSARVQLADVGEIVARNVKRAAGLDRACGSMAGWRGLQAGYCDARTQRILRRVTERRLERYGPSDHALETELAARMEEHERRLREAGPLLDHWRRFIIGD
jgi:hypothetical protein